MPTTFHRCVLLSCFLALSAFAQTTQNGQLWLMYTAQGKLESKARVFFEIQPRAAFAPLRMDQAIFRTALGYDVSSTVSLWLGVGWIPAWSTASIGSITPNEGRLFQQLIWKPYDKDVSFLTRVRFEQRVVQSSTGVFYRGRVMPRLTWTFVKSPELYWILSDELFIGFTQRGQGPISGFDQNRAFFGLGQKLAGGVAWETGYLNQYVHGRTSNRVGHTLLLQLNQTL